MGVPLAAEAAHMFILAKSRCFRMSFLKVAFLLYFVLVMIFMVGSGIFCLINFICCLIQYANPDFDEYIGNEALSFVEA